MLLPISVIVNATSSATPEYYLMTIFTSHNRIYNFVMANAHADHSAKKEINYFHSISPLNVIFISKDILFVL